MSVVPIQPVPEESPQARRTADLFYGWELRGRGWQTWNYAVDIEPPFRPIGFEGAHAGSALAMSGEEPQAVPAGEARRLCHIPLAISPARRIVAASNPLSVEHLQRLAHPIAFDLVGNSSHVGAQLTLIDEDAALAAGQTAAGSSDLLTQAARSMASALAFADLGLAREFMIPLATDPSGLSAIARALPVLEKLDRDESGTVQILAKPVREPWAPEMLRAVLGPDGLGLFAGSDDLLAPTREKMSAPLMAVVIRVMGAAATRVRAQDIVRALCDALTVGGDEPGNRLIVLPRRDIAADLQMADFLARAAYRSGMLLNLREMATVAPIANGRVSVSAACRRLPEQLTPAQRRRHVRIHGPDKAAVKTVLGDLILHDLEERHGVAVIDPTGDLADFVLRRMPRHRLADVRYIHPTAVPARLDLLACEPAARSVVAAGIGEALRRGVPGWTAETDDILARALRTVWDRLEAPTLADLYTFLANPLVREQWLDAAPQEDRAFWNGVYPAIDDTARTVLLRQLERLLQDGPARAMLCGRRLPLDLPDLLSGRVLLANLDAAASGRHADMLASLLLARLHGAIVASAAEMADHLPFFVYINNAERVMTGALKLFLADARRAGIGVIAAADTAWSDEMPISVRCSGGGKATLFMAGGERMIDVVPAPEPNDALQRVADAMLVSARRFGFGPLSAPRAPNARARRMDIAPADAGFYAGLFGTSERRIPQPKLV